MKTVMQELNEWIIKNKEHQQGSESGEQSVCDFEYCDFQELIIKIKTLILKEKTQFQDSFFEGQDGRYTEFDNYYKETYKN